MTATVAVPEAPPAAPGYAGLATRTLALAVDALVVDLAAWLVAGVVIVAASLFGLSGDVQTVLAATGAVIGALWAAGYFLFFWTTTGQTPGGRVLRMRVRQAETDAPLTLRQAVVRLVVAVLCALPLFLPYLLILVDARRRGPHDKAAHTLVVYVPRERRAR
jgi:uncharacterized RDD family membrane protein YckC